MRGKTGTQMHTGYAGARTNNRATETGADGKRRLVAQVKWALQTKTVAEVAREFAVSYRFVYGIDMCMSFRDVRAEP